MSLVLSIYHLYQLLSLIVLNYIGQYTIMSNVMPVDIDRYQISGITITSVCIMYSVGIDIYIEKKKSK